MKLWILLVGFFIFLSIVTTDGFQEDCNEPRPSLLVCTDFHRSSPPGKLSYEISTISPECGGQMLDIWNKGHSHYTHHLHGDADLIREQCMVSMRKGINEDLCGKNEWKEFCGCKAFNMSMEKKYQIQKDKCYKKEAAATELFDKYKTEIDAKCPPIPDPHCNSEDRNKCSPIPDKLCEGYLIEKLQRKQDLLRNLHNVTTPDGSNYALQQNNKKCKYQLTDAGPINVHGDDVDLDQYYDPPLMESTNKDIKEYGESESRRLLKKYKSSHSGDKVSDFNYYHHPIGEDVSAIQRQKNREVNPCDGSTYPPYLENARVIYPAVAKDIPCSDPLRPWLTHEPSPLLRPVCPVGRGNRGQPSLL